MGSVSVATRQETRKSICPAPVTFSQSGLNTATYFLVCVLCLLVCFCWYIILEFFVLEFF